MNKNKLRSVSFRRQKKNKPVTCASMAVLLCRWTMQRMPQKRGECSRWKKRTQRNCGKNTRSGHSLFCCTSPVFISQEHLNVEADDAASLTSIVSSCFLSTGPGGEGESHRKGSGRPEGQFLLRAVRQAVHQTPGVRQPHQLLRPRSQAGSVVFSP